MIEMFFCVCFDIYVAHLGTNSRDVRFPTICI